MSLAAAAVAVVIVGGFAYAGRLPGPFQGAAHVVIGAPSVSKSASPHQSATTNGTNGLSGSATKVPKSATPTPSGTAQPNGVAQMCLRYFKNPWWPGAKSWDKDDWVKLVADAGSPQQVLQYCLPYIRGSHAHWMPSVAPLPGYQKGIWSDTPPAGNGPGSGQGNNGQGNNGESSTAPNGVRSSGPDSPASTAPATQAPAPPTPATTTQQGHGGQNSRQEG